MGGGILESAIRGAIIGAIVGLVIWVVQNMNKKKNR